MKIYYKNCVNILMIWQCFIKSTLFNNSDEMVKKVILDSKISKLRGKIDLLQSGIGYIIFNRSWK